MMRVVADLHIHGPYSRATSKSTTLPLLEKYARMKGVDVLGTGDFTHPVWLGMLEKELSEDGTGILKTKSGFGFMLTTEISSVYSEGGKLRKIHNVIHVPDFATARQVNEFLSKHGRLDYDGRPTFGKLTCPELVEGLMEISGDIAVVPAHAWTPWFGIFGSMSGFDSVEECFGDQARHIFAIETGMSSDPAMNWRLSSLDGYALMSNSDAHSFWPWRIGREANVFELSEPTFGGLMKAVREKDAKHFLYTVEVDPGYGKYHMDGHRNCNVVLTPEQAAKVNDVCPVCGKRLTIGVMHRVEELADRPEGYVPRGSVPFRTLLPLSEIISAGTGVSQLSSRKVWEVYGKLVRDGMSEFEVLTSMDGRQIEAAAGKRIADLVVGIREGRVGIEPGYDGVYGRIAAGNADAAKKSSQKSLSGFV